MPGLDRTGPMGQGSQTGRKQGRCNTALNDEQFSNFGRRGGGRGFRNRNFTGNEIENTAWRPGKQRGRGRGFGRLEN